jgi:hypothetical protein
MIQILYFSGLRIPTGKGEEVEINPFPPQVV